MPGQLPAETCRRLGLITLVQAGQLTVREAAKQMRVSAKTYYVWERRYLTSLSQGFQARPNGRPTLPPNPEKERLRAELAAALQQIAELSAELKAQRLYFDYHQSRQEANGSAPLEEKKGRCGLQLLSS